MFDIEFREELIVLLVIVCDWSVDKKSVPLNAELNSVNVPESVLLVKLIVLFVRVAEAFAVNTEAFTFIWNLPEVTAVSIPRPPSIVIGLPILALNVVDESSAKSMYGFKLEPSPRFVYISLKLLLIIVPPVRRFEPVPSFGELPKFSKLFGIS